MIYFAGYLKYKKYALYFKDVSKEPKESMVAC